MMQPPTDEHRRAQHIARRAMNRLKPMLRPGCSEAKIATAVGHYLRLGGATGCWYHNVPALVLVGERTPLSISGASYKPDSLCLQEADLVTIDLSPQVGGAWGDYARSFIISTRPTSTQEERNRLLELHKAMQMEAHLHEELFRFARPETTFSQLREHMAGVLSRHGYENLDYRSNFGHTIERRLEDRRFIEPGRELRLADAGLFTFEPHIRRNGGRFGLKHEDIYYFADGQLMRL